MQSILLYIQVFQAFISLIRQVVDELNKQFPEAGMGQTKLAIAIQTVNTGLTTIENAEHFVDKLTPMIPALLSTVADGRKAVKALQQSSPAA